jgi:hypothetical protein
MSKNKIMWPGWRYNPETGAGEIFQSEEEVPEGWVKFAELAPIAEAAEDEEVELTEDDEAAIKALIEDNTKDELIARLVALNEGREDDDQIEFLESWPKRPLAVAIHTAEGE